MAKVCHRPSLIFQIILGFDEIMNIANSRFCGNKNLLEKYSYSVSNYYKLMRTDI